jgi:pentatricopeptide repeat protein
VNCKSFRCFANIARSSIPSSTLAAYEGEPRPSEAERLISIINNPHTAFQIYRTLVKNQKPTLGVFKNLITACLDLRQPQRLKDVWKEMEKHSVIPDYWCFSLLLRVCGKNRDSLLAKQLFSKIKNGEFKFREINVIDCAQLIQALSSGSKMQDAMDVLNWMGDLGIKPNAILYLCILKSCKDLSTGRRIHAHIISSQIELDIKLQNSLLNMYSKCRSMDEARSIFDTMQSKDIITWNAMIQGYRENGKESLELFERMKKEGLQPNQVTYTIVLSICANLADISLGRKIHSEIDECGVEWNVEMKTSLLDMYSKCGSMDKARSIFDTMQSKDIITWSAMIKGYGQNGRGKEALELFEKMKQEGLQPNQVTYTIVLSICANLAALSLGRKIHSEIDECGVEWNIEMKTSLLDMYSKCGSMDKARSIFDTMQSRNISTWNAMIQGYGQNGNGKEALELFENMKKEGLQPDQVTYTIVLSTCANLAALSLGRKIHSEIDECGVEWNIEMKNSLLSMYSKCGSMDEVRSIFDTMQSRNIITWNAMIQGYGQNGNGREALKLFEQMKQEMIHPDSVTLVALLNAFSHAGLVREALKYFHSMKEEYKIIPENSHYNCVVDALSRAGLLEEAENLIGTMDRPDVVTWTALLGGCRWNNDIERAERAAENIIKLDPHRTSTYVLLANVYAGAGRWDEVRAVRARMKSNGIRKIPGQTWITVKEKVHSFLVDDKSHELANEIQAELKQLYSEMKESGYIPNTKFVLHNMNDEEKGHHLCSHSEKLAIGLGLISTPPGTPLLITKNLRVCPDCHSATKAISKIRNREITVRDVNRFHHFKNGECSCKDYW